MDFLGGNSYALAASDAESALRQKEPLLLHAEEHVVLAFKNARDPRDKSYLTTHRILVKDGKGIGSKRKNFSSTPYTSVKAFYVQTAGGFLDGDTELKVYSGAGMVEIDFGKQTVDLFSIQQFLNEKVLKNFQAQGGQDEVATAIKDLSVQSPNQSKQQAESASVANLMDWLGDNAHQMDPRKVEKRFKTENPVLMNDEKVELAFKSGRDFTIFTDKRIFIIDVQGLTGKQIKFFSLPWPCVRGFSVETAGSFLDRDTEMTIHTNLLSKPRITQDFRQGRADLWAINKYISNKVLGEDLQVQAGIDLRQGHVDPAVSLTNVWARENNRPLDAVEMNKVFHASPPILQSNETVELAFKGIRDVVLLTTKRIVKIDRKDFTGTRTEYSSIPWKSVLAFAVTSAGGSMLDHDAEANLYTDMYFIPPENNDDSAKPGMAMLEIDFNKKMVDIVSIKRYLNQKLLTRRGLNGTAPPIGPMTNMESPKDYGFEKLLTIMGNDQRAINPTELDAQLHHSVPLLLDDERVIMAFKGGRDSTVFTTMRVLSIDVQGWSSKKVSYTSIPYSSIRAFSVESAGSWDRDSEIKLFTRNLWSLATFPQDFRKGKADIVVIQKFLSALILCDEPQERDLDPFFDGTGLIPPTAASAGDFLAWLGSNSKEVEDVSVLNSRLHQQPPLLLTHETIEKAYKCGRDMFVYTNLRLVRIDVQGITGKKVEYESFPWRWTTGFAVETAGHLDRDAEVYLGFGVPSRTQVQQDILVKRGDVMEMQKYLTEKMMMGEFHGKSSSFIVADSRQRAGRAKINK